MKCGIVLRSHDTYRKVEGGVFCSSGFKKIQVKKNQATMVISGLAHFSEIERKMKSPAKLHGA